MSQSFIQKLEQIIATNQSHVLLRISPNLIRMPAPVKAYDDPFLPFGKLIVNATRDVVAGYIFDFPAYLSIGAAGAVALERTIAYVDKSLITLIDGGFVGAGYAHMTDEGTFNADALILGDDAHLQAYLTRADRSAFVVNEQIPNADPLRSGGIFWRITNELTISGINRLIRLKIVGDEVVYADGTSHIAKTLHRTLSELRDS